MTLAKEYDVHSIAFPAISTGVYGYPKEEACNVAVKTVIDWLENNAGYDMKVVFSCFDERTADLYKANL